jgi:hypothetical protein
LCADDSELLLGKGGLLLDFLQQLMDVSMGLKDRGIYHTPAAASRWEST